MSRAQTFLLIGGVIIVLVAILSKPVQDVIFQDSNGIPFRLSNFPQAINCKKCGEKSPVYVDGDTITYQCSDSDCKKYFKYHANHKAPKPYDPGSPLRE